MRELEWNAQYTAGYQPALVKAFRKRMQAIRAAHSEIDLAAIRGNRFEKLKGDRSHQYSVRLNDQYRLILEIEEQGTQRALVVVGIEDYH
ncbi:MAG: type II toxin-antitoxin system RelE/ParE family toxin [Thermoanaerobaculia bacterium]